MEWITNNWAEVIVVVLLLTLAVVTAKMQGLKKALKETKDLTAATDEFVGKLCDAAADNHYTAEEWAEIKEAGAKVLKEAKDLGQMAAELLLMAKKLLTRK